MKIAAVSGDLVVKLALGAAAIGALVYVWRKLPSAGEAVAAAKDAAWAVTPWNQDNVIAGGVNSVGAALVTDPAGNGKNADGSWSLGGWLYDVTH